MMNFGFDTHGKLEVFHKYHFSVFLQVIYPEFFVQHLHFTR
jgi:hypothetical protein